MEPSSCLRVLHLQEMPGPGPGPGPAMLLPDTMALWVVWTHPESQSITLDQAGTH